MLKSSLILEQIVNVTYPVVPNAYNVLFYGLKRQYNEYRKFLMMHNNTFLGLDIIFIFTISCRSTISVSMCQQIDIVE